MATIKTRILIISDTHAAPPKPSSGGLDEELFDPRSYGHAVTGYRVPLPPADVVLHAGDLTRRGRPQELRDAFSMIQDIDAPLKIVIAGNHDLCLDPRYEDISADTSSADAAAKIVKDAESHGVRYLDEGTYTFDLDNGARLSVYASPWTPQYGYWAFQYSQGHSFAIPPGVDIAMTHGPPYGVLDLAGGGGRSERAGCRDLYAAVRRAKPRVHCFGHIHEAWGAYLAGWKESFSPEGIDAEASKTVANLDTMRPLTTDSQDVQNEKMAKLRDIARRRGMELDLTQGVHRVDPGEQTLFVNAAIMDISYRPVQPPWIIDIDLPPAT
ncbi:DNA repair exonuclease SbcCD nuclease subunit [Geosmithia morbida]|uniref:DNA repair exonuclease SbcCD nuclease subunit n=1 Tax=Geosmithia morbida TaxID=1094350 RepID=A0A9P5D285_9HYPO|nr:DNA repair exonuclease SbcCD nuclease subunit [Geosmithia morbida]KAF4124758.1 DNA repair exonuclease SbcCD nuclease subunit [Geosmithia morbida]